MLLHPFFYWWSQAGSNRRPPACKAGALPAELWPHEHLAGLIKLAQDPGSYLVGLGRFELPTSPLSGVRSNQLSYRPGQVSNLMLCIWPRARIIRRALLFTNDLND